jgi:predicted dehydrogenase
MSTPESSPSRSSRRSFLKKSLLAGGAALAPMILPARVLGKGGGVAPSNRITLGCIGIGPRGNHVLGAMLGEPDLQVLATCDIQAALRASVKRTIDEHHGNKDCATYRDFRELLARPDIDAVLITTGDRWHAVGSIYAARAGKDVYAEKPCGVGMGQAIALGNTIESTGRIFQVGTQRRNIANFQFAAFLALSGRLGRLHTMHASIVKPRINYTWLPGQPEPPRDEIDWDLWLGPCPWRPYHPDYVIKRAWRGYYDFDSGAQVMEWGVHTIDLCQWAAGMDHTAPVEHVPEGDVITARYANGLKLVMRPTGWLGQDGQERAFENWSKHGTCPVRYEGDAGWIETGDLGTFDVHPASLRNEWKAYTKARGTDAMQHTRDFLNCVKTRSLAAANHRVMRQTHVAGQAAAIAWTLGRKVTFDPKTESFPGDEEANRMRFRAAREPWIV